MSSIWFWGILITFELLLISLVGYGLTSFQAYNDIANQLHLNSTQLLAGQSKPASEYFIINKSGQIQQGSTNLKKPIPSQLKTPTSLPDKSVIFDDLYAYRMQSIGRSDNYLVTYQQYKKTNPWPNRILILAVIMVGGTILLTYLFQILNSTREGSFAIS